MDLIIPRRLYFVAFTFLSSLIILSTQVFSESTESTKTFSAHRYPGSRAAGPAVSPAQTLGTTTGKPLFAPGEIVVRYFDTATPNDKARVRAKRNYTVKHVHKYLQAETLKIPTTMSPDSYNSVKAMGNLCSELMKDPAVKYAEPNYYFYAQEGVYGPDEIGYYPNDPFFSSDTAFYVNGGSTYGLETLPPGGMEIIWSANTTINNTSTLYNYYTYTQQFNYFVENFVIKPPPQYQSVLTNESYINFQSSEAGTGNSFTQAFALVPGGWDFQQGNSSVKVAVIDTGVMYEHEDLIGKILAGHNYVNDSGSHAGGIAEDDNGHGTHVAGLIAAQTNNNKGTAGSAPNVMIIPIKVLDAGGTGTDDEVSEGILGAVEEFGANILNMSFGAGTSSQLVEEAVNQVLGEGAIPIAAAGNNGTNFSSETTCFQQVVDTFEPALIPGVISVGSWEYVYPPPGSGDTVPTQVGYSNYGFVTSSPGACYTNWGVKVFADGGGPISLIWSTYLYPLSGLVSDTIKYQPLMGTSMASPQVAGLAALLYAKGFRDLNSITAAIESSCWDPLAVGQDPSTYATYTVTFGSFTNAIYTQPARNSHPEPFWGYGAIDAFAALAAYKPAINVSFVSDSVLDCASLMTGAVNIPSGFTGNCNGVLDPGETDGLMVTLQNTGNLSMTNIVGVLQTSDPYTQIISNTVSYPDTLVGNLATPVGNFVVSVSSSAPAQAGYTIRFIEAVTFNTNLGQTTFNIPFDITLSVNGNQFVSAGGVFHAIDLETTLFGPINGTNPVVDTTIIQQYHPTPNGIIPSFIYDTNQSIFANSLLPVRYETGVAPAEPGYTPSGNYYDGYLETGETTGIYPNLVNNSGTIFLGTETTYPQVSGIIGTLSVFTDTNPSGGLLGVGTTNNQIYYSYITGINNGVYQFTGGAVAAISSTEFDYNLLTGPTIQPATNADASFGQAILQINLSAPSDPSANWLDRIPVCYSEETSVSMDHYKVTDPNGSSILVPGTSATMKVFVRNTSPLPIEPSITNTVTAFLSTSDPAVVMSDTISYYSSIANPGDMYGPDGLGFAFSIFPNTPQNHKINFLATINAQLDTTSLLSTDFNPTSVQWNCPFVVEMGEAVLVDNSVTIDDSTALNNPILGLYNNGNGGIDPGELIQMNMTFWNRHYDQQLDGLIAYLSTTTPQVTILSSSTYVGNIGARALVTPVQPFRFSIPLGFTSDQIDWAVTLIDPTGKLYVNTFSTPVNPYCVLPPLAGTPYTPSSTVLYTATDYDNYTTFYPVYYNGISTTLLFSSSVPNPGVPVSPAPPSETSPTILDFYNSGTTDAVYGNDSGIITGVGITLAGPALLPGFPVLLTDNGNSVEIRKPIAIGDIDNTTTNTMVVVAENGKLYTIRPYGFSTLISDLTPYQDYFTTPPVLADLTGSGAKDIIVGATLNFSTTSTQQGAIFAYDHNGNPIPGFAASAALSGPIVVQPAVGNIFGGDLPEVVAVSQAGDVAGYTYDTAISAYTPFFLLNTGAPNNTPPLLGDIEGSGTPDIIVKSTNGNVYAWRPYDGSPVPGFPIYVGQDLLPVPFLADINQDGNPDIVVGAIGNLEVISVVNGVGTMLYQIPADNTLNLSCGADDHSGYPRLFATGNGGGGAIQVFTLTPSGAGVSCAFGSGFEYSTPGILRFPDPYTAATTVGGDATNTGIVAVNQDGTLGGYLSVFDSNPTLDFWVEYAHDISHTNSYSQPLNTITYATLWTTDNTPYKDAFYYLNEINWLAFHGIASHLYRITVTTPNGSTASPEITLYDPTGVNNLGGPSSSKIEAAVPTTDTYYVKISNQNTSYGPSATYQVSIYDVTANTYVPEEMWKSFSE